MAVREIIEIRINIERTLDTFEYVKGLRDKKYPDLTEEERAQSDQELWEMVKKIARDWEIKKAKGLV
jgi:hypothetical protein